MLCIWPYFPQNKLAPRSQLVQSQVFCHSLPGPCEKSSQGNLVRCRLIWETIIKYIRSDWLNTSQDICSFISFFDSNHTRYSDVAQVHIFIIYRHRLPYGQIFYQAIISSWNFPNFLEGWHFLSSFRGRKEASGFHYRENHLPPGRTRENTFIHIYI